MGKKEMIGILLFAAFIIPASMAGADLTAGDFDDNLNYDHFERYMEEEYRKDTAGILPEVDLGGRVTVELKDSDGRGLPDHPISIVDASTGDVVIDSFTGFDGSFRFFPGFDGNGTGNSFEVIVEDGNDTRSIPLESEQLDDDRTVEIVLNNENFRTPDILDICLVIDTTGSMKDEISYLKREMENIINGINSTYQVNRMRFALVVYRDTGDEYIVRDHEFTDSVDLMNSRLRAQEARGGGDYPEAMDMAIQKANDLNWSESDAARLMFLVADAPPHDSYLDDTVRWIKDSRSKGIHIYPLASSGVADVAEFIMRIAAATTHGRYLFLTDDSGIGNSHAEPHIPGYIVTTLKDLMIRIVDSEISGHRVEARPDRIIRTVGYVVDGRAVSEEEYLQMMNRTGSGNTSGEGMESDDEEAVAESDGDEAPVSGEEDVMIEERLDHGDPVPSTADGSTEGVEPLSPPAPEDGEGGPEIYAWDPIDDDDGDDSFGEGGPCLSSAEEECGGNSSIFFGTILFVIALLAGSAILIGYLIKRGNKK